MPFNILEISVTMESTPGSTSLHSRKESWLLEPVGTPVPKSGKKVQLRVTVFQFARMHRGIFQQVSLQDCRMGMMNPPRSSPSNFVLLIHSSHSATGTQCAWIHDGSFQGYIFPIPIS